MIGKVNSEQRDRAIALYENYLCLAAASDFGARFDKALLVGGGADELIGSIPIFSKRTVPKDLECCWDIRLLIPREETNDGSLLDLHQCRTIPKATVPRLREITPIGRDNIWDCCAEYRQWHIDTNGKLGWDRQCYSAIRGRNVRVLNPHDDLVWTPEEVKIRQNVFLAMMGFADGIRRYWLAYIRLGDSPRIVMPTDPTGVRSLWALRDIPNGKKRRDALLHWVSEHWRKSRRSPDDASYVKRHLRGKRNLTCDGLTVDIVPAELNQNWFEEDEAA
jgi:hypothetical protein